jgi:thiol-disulfide isomerase/thioredoxin
MKNEMKNKAILILLSSLLLLACNEKEKDVALQLDELLEKNSTISSMEYDSFYKMKYLDYNDTTLIKAKVIFVRDELDSIHNGAVWFHKKDSFADYVKYYDTKSFYLVNNLKKEVIKSTLEEPSPYMFKGNSDGGIINTYFLNNSVIKKFTQDSIYRSHVSDSKDQIDITINYPDDDEVFNKIKHIYIDQDSSYVKRITYKAQLDTLIEYREWDLKNVQFNGINAKELNEKFLSLTKGYDFKDYEKPISKAREKVTSLNNFKGESLSNPGNKFDLKNYRDKIIIIDFWYRTCPPCIKSIPQLNNIYDKYVRDDVVMFGINDIDLSASKRDLLPLHIKNNNIKYPNILVSKSESDNYELVGYPTFYIIDKSGKIVFSKLGYDENLETKVDSVMRILK